VFEKRCVTQDSGWLAKGRKALKKAQNFVQKMVDVSAGAVLYFILPVGREVSFCALFSVQTPSRSIIQGGNARAEKAGK